jgi:hypothetical protein
MRTTAQILRTTYDLPYYRPDFVLVTPIPAKTQKLKTNLGGWVLRSGRGQLRETGSTVSHQQSHQPQTAPT